MSSLGARWWPRTGREVAPGAAAGRWDRYVDNGPNSSRAYAVYTPAGLNRHQSVPLVVVLHGCKQSGAEAALGTDVNAYADRAGFVALYPEQSVRDNPQLCWNWFRPGHQSRGLGEPAAIARITEQVLSGRHSRGGPRLDRNRVHVMGLSAGGAMAGVLAAAYPDVYASAGIHSAPQYGAARSTLTAVMAMRSGGPDPERQGRLAHAAMGPRARVVPVMVIQGDADTTVWTSNGDNVVRQWLATSRLAAGGQVSDRPAGDGDDGNEGSGLDFSRPDTSEVLSSPGGLSYRVSCWNDDVGRPVVRYWLVGDLGHAWSGGVSAGSYTDSRGPNATEAMVTFFGQCARDRDRASLAVRPPRPGSRDRSGRFRAGTARLRDWAVRVRNSSGRVRDSSSGVRDSSGGVRDGERSGSGMVTNPDRRSS